MRQPTEFPPQRKQGVLSFHRFRFLQNSMAAYTMTAIRNQTSATWGIVSGPAGKCHILFLMGPASSVADHPMNSLAQPESEVRLVWVKREKQ